MHKFEILEPVLKEKNRKQRLKIDDIETLMLYGTDGRPERKTCLQWSQRGAKLFS